MTSGLGSRAPTEDAGSRPTLAGPGLAGAKAPPFQLPGEHFAAALVFLALGAAGLVAAAPQLALGAYPAPRVLAVAHLFTLGWITTSIMGALYQFLPVALGEPVRSIRLAHLTCALYLPGLGGFVAGLLAGSSPLLLGGATLLGAGILLFVGNLAATLRRAARRDLTWWALAAAAFYLLVTLGLGLALAGNLRWGFLGASRPTALAVHLHVALAGWVALVMVGVAQRLLPMFLLTYRVGDGPARAAVGMLAAGAGVLTFLHHAPPLVSRWLPAALLGGGVACFLAQARRFFRHRHRPSLDPGLRLAGAALALLGMAVLLAGPVLAGGAPPRMATAYVLALVLAISLFVAAHYYKIIPFLVWYHRFGPLAGKRAVPRVADLYSARTAGAAGVLLALGAVGLVAAVALGQPGPARGAALILAAGAITEALQMLSLARIRA